LSLLCLQKITSKNKIIIACYFYSLYYLCLSAFQEMFFEPLAILEHSLKGRLFMKKAKVLVALVICAFLLVPMSYARDTWEMAQSDSYKEKTGGMLGRGIVNVATSPVDIFVQTVNRSKEGPALIGTMTGMAGGLGCTALRASSGIVDVALFWVPGFNGFPVAKSYDNCLEESSEIEEPIQAPAAIAPVVTEAAPLVTVAETPAAPVRKHVTKKHSAYDYVKK
jgi:putative exosortase-associated protein (TIGR04073 family)